PDLYSDGRRFEPDVENSAGIFGLYARLTEIMETRPREIEARIMQLTDRLCEGLQYKDYVVTSPRGKKEKSGIVTFVHPNFQTEEIYKRLIDANIIVGLQGMGVQVSPHYYNTKEEIENLLDALS
ncbi:MAG: aminotransferase class V-fold PLP-dependent enzyme, partial [Chloroflexota bacterium]